MNTGNDSSTAVTPRPTRILLSVDAAGMECNLASNDAGGGREP